MQALGNREPHCSTNCSACRTQLGGKYRLRFAQKNRRIDSAYQPTGASERSRLPRRDWPVLTSRWSEIGKSATYEFKHLTMSSMPGFLGSLAPVSLLSQIFIKFEIEVDESTGKLHAILAAPNSATVLPRAVRIFVFVARAISRFESSLWIVSKR